ncbi:hypothetical protein A1332_17675 [Methylomonas methanica]|uniref:Uncharacterized protein n=1 Tax=Methylomonas methanica TaxID=421 RepID=A0A177M7H7_METMH|nr:hypothetical protein A1332_17675 [Methylomonas methanica]
MLYHEKRQRQLQAKYGVSAGQDFDNLAEDTSLLLIKKEALQREIAAMEREKHSAWGKTRQQLIKGFRRLIALSARLKP